MADNNKKRNNSGKKMTPSKSNPSQDVNNSSGGGASGGGGGRVELSSQQLLLFEKNYIFPTATKKKEAVLVTDKFKCQLCNYVCDNANVAKEHCQRDKHVKNLRSREHKLMMECLPAPCDIHNNVLHAVLLDHVKKVALSEKEIARRKTVAEEIKSVILLAEPDFTVDLFGSLTTGLSLKDSDVNLCMAHSSGVDSLRGQMITNVWNLLLNKVDELKKDESSSSPLVHIEKVNYSYKNPPCVLLMDDKGVWYKINIRYDYTVESDRLVSKYLDIDPRARQLALLFRSFIQIAGVDNPNKGGFVSRVAPVLTIFYLQNKCDPILLPNLQRIAERNLKHIPKEALYFVHLTDANFVYLDDLQYLSKFFDCQKNVEKLSDLWLGLLRFYIMEFNKEDYVVSITDFHPVTKFKQNSSSKRLTVQDPCDSKCNLCRTVSPPDNHNFIMDQLYSCYLYFGIPQMRESKKALFTQIQRKQEVVAAGDNKDKDAETLIGLTTAYTNLPGFKKPIKKIQKSAFEQAHLMTVSEDNDAIPMDFIKAFRDLCSWTLNNLCLQNPKLDWLKVENWQLDFKLLEIKENQVARWVRFASAFAALIFETIWKECFRRENYCIKWREMQLILIESANACLNETILSNEADDCSLLHPNSQIVDSLTEFTSVVGGSGEDDSMIMDTTTDTIAVDAAADDNVVVVANNVSEIVEDQECNDDEEENEDEVVDVLIPEGFEDEDEEEDENQGGERRLLNLGDTLSTSPPTNDNCQRQEIEIYSKSGWEIAIHQRRRGIEIFAEDDTRPGYYNAQLIKDSVTDPESLHFQFNKVMVMHKQGIVPLCSSCNCKGHLRDDCPQDLPNIDPQKRPLLSALSHEKSRWIDNMLEIVAQNVEPTPAVMQMREQTFDRLKKVVLNQFSRATMRKFGSSLNGFGCLTSDLDVNLSFELQEDHDKYLAGSSMLKIVQQVEKLLKNSNLFIDVIAIRHAKVPIVKFRDRENQIDGDISFSNKLAVENTRLLKTYSTLEPHCHTLGLALKHLVKQCSIGDASRGSLSSYAYILLLIHYMQQRGYLPVLQQIHEQAEKPMNLIEGFDVWFQEDLDVIKRHWSQVSPAPSLSQIWLGFFDYYLYEFKHDEQVATVRQRERLLKIDKLFTGRDFAIEDPFELTHNLGVGLSRKMFCYILNIFHEVLQLHHQPKSAMTSFSEIINCYFNCNRLAHGHEPPRDRGCKICGKIGHLANDCTTKPQKSQDNGKNCRPCTIPVNVPAPGGGGGGKESSAQQQQQASPAHLLYIPPRRNDHKFSAAQPFGELGKSSDGFSVELVNLVMSNNERILLPVLSHPNHQVIEEMTRNLFQFSHRLTPDHLRNMVAPSQMHQLHQQQQQQQQAHSLLQDNIIQNFRQMNLAPQDNHHQYRRHNSGGNNGGGGGGGGQAVGQAVFSRRSQQEGSGGGGGGGGNARQQFYSPNMYQTNVIRGPIPIMNQIPMQQSPYNNNIPTQQQPSVNSRQRSNGGPRYSRYPPAPQNNNRW